MASKRKHPRKRSQLRKTAQWRQTIVPALLIAMVTGLATGVGEHLTGRGIDLFDSLANKPVPDAGHSNYTYDYTNTPDRKLRKLPGRQSMHYTDTSVDAVGSYYDTSTYGDDPSYDFVRYN